MQQTLLIEYMSVDWLVVSAVELVLIEACQQKDWIGSGVRECEFSEVTRLKFSDPSYSFKLSDSSYKSQILPWI